MQFSATIAAIFASVAFAAVAPLAVGSTDPIGAAMPDLPAIPPQVMECFKKCDNEKTLPEAFKCLLDKCAGAVNSFAKGPTPSAGIAAPTAGAAGVAI